jgi:hypothetical protein
MGRYLETGLVMAILRIRPLTFDALEEPAAQLAIWLKPQPGELDCDRSRAVIAGFADALLSPAGPTTCLPIGSTITSSRRRLLLYPAQRTPTNVRKCRLSPILQVRKAEAYSDRSRQSGVLAAFLRRENSRWKTLHFG